MDYVHPPELEEIPIERAALRVYLALLMRAGASTDGREENRNAAIVLYKTWPVEIAEWCKNMGMKPLGEVSEADKQ